MSPSPAPALLVLRRQVDARWPDRSRASDGIMGDASHRRRKSDHNLGNAIDLTHDPAHGFDAGALAEELRRQMAAGAPGRPSYIIFNRRIASPRTGWGWAPYTGSNPHRSHVHISIRADRRDMIRPWSLSSR